MAPAAPEDLLRARRVFRPAGRALIAAIDHAMFMNAGPSLRDPGRVIETVVADGANAVIATFGVARRFGASFGRAGLILRVDGGPTALFDGEGDWPLLFSAEDALRLGADGVVCMGFPGAACECATMGNLARLASDCRKWGLLLLAEMIPGGFGRPDLHTPENIAMAARLGAEVGADAIKTAYTGSAETFCEVTQACYCPVLIQGGARKSCDAEVLSTVRDAVRAGGAGAAVGRNLWQHADPAGFATALSAAIHDGASIGEAPGIPGYVRPATGGEPRRRPPG